MRTYLAFDAAGLPFVGIRTLPLGWAHKKLRALNNYYCVSLPGVARYQLTDQDLTNVFESLSDLVGAGVPLSGALHTLEESTSSQAYRYFLHEILYRVHEQGEKLAQAFSAYPDFFSNQMLAILHLSEQTGNYAQGFKTIANLLRKKIQWNKAIGNIRNQLLMILMFAATSFFSLLILLVPQMKVFFTQNNIPISVMTQGVIWLSDIVCRVTWGDAMCHLLVFFCVWTFITRTVVKRLLPRKTRTKHRRFIAAFPVIHSYVRCNFWFSINSLMQAGISFAGALKLCAQNPHDSLVSVESHTILTKITQGEKIAHTLSESLFASLLNKQLLPTIAFSDDTKNVVHSIYTLEIRYFEQRIQNLKQRIYPLGLSLIALGILGMIYVIFVPIYQSVGVLL